MVELPFREDLSAYDLADHLQGRISAAGLVPPVMVAHSLASFVAQKLLESHPLAALALINPVPNDPRRCVSSLVKSWEKCCAGAAGGAALSRYYGFNSLFASPAIASSRAGPDFPAHPSLLRHLVSDEDAKVRLEPGSVPMLVVRSAGDSAHCSAEDLLALLAAHDIPQESVVNFAALDRLPMRTALDSADAEAALHADPFHAALLSWVEAL